MTNYNRYSGRNKDRNNRPIDKAAEIESETTVETEPAIVETNVKTVVVTCGALNVREQASTDSEVLKIVHEGDKLVVLEDCGDWYKIEHDATPGYVMRSFVK